MLPTGKTVVKVDSVKINDAGEALIPVEIKNNAGMVGFRFGIEYNTDELEILDITPNSDILTDTFKTNLGSEGENGLLVSWYQDSDLVQDGTLFTIKAKLKDEFTGDISPINIIYAENNISNAIPANVEADYISGYVMRDSFVRNNDVLGADKFSCDMYFSNMYPDQSAIGIIAFYDENGKLLRLGMSDITVSSGKQTLNIPVSTTAYHHYKVFIWKSLVILLPLV